MTVSELIEKLRKMPSDSIVSIEGCDGCEGDAGVVEGRNDNTILITRL